MPAARGSGPRHTPGASTAGGRGQGRGGMVASVHGGMQPRMPIKHGAAAPGGCRRQQQRGAWEAPAASRRPPASPAAARVPRPPPARRCRSRGLPTRRCPARGLQPRPPPQNQSSARSQAEGSAPRGPLHTSRRQDSARNGLSGCSKANRLLPSPSPSSCVSGASQPPRACLRCT